MEFTTSIYNKDDIDESFEIIRNKTKSDKIKEHLKKTIKIYRTLEIENDELKTMIETLKKENDDLRNQIQKLQTEKKELENQNSESPTEEDPNPTAIKFETVVAKELGKLSVSEKFGITTKENKTYIKTMVDCGVFAKSALKKKVNKNQERGIDVIDFDRTPKGNNLVISFGAQCKTKNSSHNGYYKPFTGHGLNELKTSNTFGLSTTTARFSTIWHNNNGAHFALISNDASLFRKYVNFDYHDFKTTEVDWETEILKEGDFKGEGKFKKAVIEYPIIKCQDKDGNEYKIKIRDDDETETTIYEALKDGKLSVYSILYRAHKAGINIKEDLIQKINVDVYIYAIDIQM